MFSKENYTGKTIMYVLITDKYTLKINIKESHCLWEQGKRHAKSIANLMVYVNLLTM